MARLHQGLSTGKMGVRTPKCEDGVPWRYAAIFALTRAREKSLKNFSRSTE
jgi:hypothetical protein